MAFNTTDIPKLVQCRHFKNTDSARTAGLLLVKWAELKRGHILYSLGGSALKLNSGKLLRKFDNALLQLKIPLHSSARK